MEITRLRCSNVRFVAMFRKWVVLTDILSFISVTAELETGRDFGLDPKMYIRTQPKPEFNLRPYKLVRKLRLLF